MKASMNIRFLYCNNDRRRQLTLIWRELLGMIVSSASHRVPVVAKCVLMAAARRKVTIGRVVHQLPAWLFNPCRVTEGIFMTECVVVVGTTPLMRQLVGEVRVVDLAIEW